MSSSETPSPWPVEPPPNGWRLPDPRNPPRENVGDLLAVGADLEPGTVLAAYRSGLFPMHTVPGRLGWWSPDPRGVLPPESLRVSRSLQRSVRRFEVTVDNAFAAVVDGCAAPYRSEGWITADIARAYQHMHELGWAHSVEVWDHDRLVGGLYGVAVGGLFAGESMFHTARDASKVALVHLVKVLREDGCQRLLDVQWLTPHLQSLGAIAVPRPTYLDRLAVALTLPLPPAFDHPPATPATRVAPAGPRGPRLR